MYKRKVCLVDIPADTSKLLTSILDEYGHLYLEFNSISSFVSSQEEVEAKIIITSYPPKTFTAPSFIELLRKSDRKLPVIFIGTEENHNLVAEILKDRLSDFIPIPVSTPTLIARMETLIDKSLRVPEVSSDKIKIKSLTINLTTKRVTNGKKEIKLTPTEFSLLSFLAINKNRVISQQKILQSVWDLPEGSSTKVVPVYIGYLRDKIGKVDGKDIITTVAGFGYKIE